MKRKISFNHQDKNTYKGKKLYWHQTQAGRGNILKILKKETETQDFNFRQTDPQILIQRSQEELLELLGKLFP